MIAKAHSATLNGIEALPIVIEVDLQPAKEEAMFVLVGLPDQAVGRAESGYGLRSRIRS